MAKRASAPTRPVTESARGSVIQAWEMVSEHRATQYETILHTNGDVTCNCPGWIYARKGQPRTCKHTQRIEDEAGRLFRAYQNGEIKVQAQTEEPAPKPKFTPRTSDRYPQPVAVAGMLKPKRMFMG